MEEFVVYILFSEVYGKTYVGFTSNLIERFNSHNYLSKKGYTIRFRPWQVIYVEFFTTKSEALKREKLLKSGKGREFIKEIISKL
ncbi:GIY-YIG nuclease family protein [Flavobacterium covae]|nr:GIY-YIG nuclease family protein [Flavobacterium covae]AMA49972.1 endonuclease [Flavobacterium covae]MCJ1808592.1 GIY-YIG nuclease family protein [Flavobacterium covae]